MTLQHQSASTSTQIPEYIYFLITWIVTRILSILTTEYVQRGSYSEQLNHKNLITTTFNGVLYLLSFYTFWLFFCFCKVTCKNPQRNNIFQPRDGSDVIMVTERLGKAMEFLYIRTTVGTLVLCLFDSALIWVCPSPPPARPHDFFDAQTMDAIRHRAICLNLATHIESVGNGHSVVFHSTVSPCAALLLLFVL